MRSLSGTLAAPFPYFGGKALACETVWGALGDPVNYVEPFAGSAAMLLGRQEPGKVETINDADGFVANFWRAVSHDPDAVTHYADWPCIESDLEARHAWLVNRSERLRWQLEDPDFYDAKIAGWWVWGACNWIGSGWCAGEGPHLTNGARLFDSRKLPHLGNAGQGINRKLPHLGDAGQGEHPRSAYIREWMMKLAERLRDVRVTCGDWTRVVKDSVTTRHGITGVFLDPPYTRGKMDYAAGGVGGEIASDVREWCKQNGDNKLLRIVLCGHQHEHDELLQHGWHLRTWKARKGYAVTDEAVSNSASETLWCSPSCVAGGSADQTGLFDGVPA